MARAIDRHRGRTESRRLIANASQGFRLGCHCIHGMRVARGRATRRTNLRGVTTCLMHVRGSVASVRRSYFNEGIVVATIPPVTSDDLRAVRDGNLGSRPSEGRLETFSTCARHFPATKGRRRNFARDENSMRASERASFSFWTRRDLKVCAKIMDNKLCIEY